LTCARLYLLAAHPVLVHQFIRKLGYWPNPAVPQRFHEKILWRKLVDHNPIFVDLTDKLAAKRIARTRCPGLAVAKVIWTGTEPRSLPVSLVRQDVAVKANHSSGSNVFVNNGKPEYSMIVARAERWMARRRHHRHGEWSYGSVPRVLFVEEKLILGGGNLPTDVKVHVFAGGIGHVWIADALSRRSRTYSAQVRPLAVRDTVNPREDQELPDSPAIRALILQALDLAPRLLGRLDYARVDFMVAGGRLFFGEYTLYPGAGYDRWLDPGLTERAEALWDLSHSHFLRKVHRGPVRLYADALRSAIDRRGAPSGSDS
jgi:teichuronopeptide biosynthesis TupA-like protein